MESALYGIYAIVVFVSEILLVRCAHSFDFWYVNNSYVNTVRQHFSWSILYIQRMLKGRMTSGLAFKETKMKEMEFIHLPERLFPTPF